MKPAAGKLWTALAAAAMMTACASIAPPQPPSLDLPKPPVDLRASRKGDRVTLSWTVPSSTTDRQTIRSVGATRICRGTGLTLIECGTPSGEAPAQLGPKFPKQKVTASYTDALPATMASDDPASTVTYAVEVLNADGRGAGLSNQVHVALARTLPPPRDFAAHVSAQGVVLNWTNDLPPANSQVRYVYRVYRHPLGGHDQTLVGEVPPGESSATLTDSSFEWEKTYVYRVEAVTVIGAQQLEGEDSPEVQVFADDVFPPAVPSGLQAVFSGPGQQPFIDLIWGPVSDVDLDGYNVYRREEGGTAVKVNAELVKSPAFRDTTVAAGKHYVYAVTAVDVRGNESARSEEAAESVP